jgi:hypothetical protein
MYPSQAVIDELILGRLKKGRKAKRLYLVTAASGLKEPVKGLYFIPVPEPLG